MSMDLEATDLMDMQSLKAALPKSLGSSVSVKLLATVNELIQSDDLMRQGYRDNVLGYSSVLQGGKWKIQDYLNAVRFCTYRLSGKGIGVSYALTFPERQKRLEAEGASSNYISSLSTQYHQSKIVSTILEQAMIPVYITNADIYQKAINVQAKLMNEATSELVRTQAANSLLTHLKAPEKRKIEIDVSINEGSAIEELRETTRLLAMRQLEGITSGSFNVKEIAESTILKGEVLEHE